MARKEKRKPRIDAAELANHQFDKRKYIELEFGVVRDAKTGQLVVRPPVKGKTDVK